MSHMHVGQMLMHFTIIKKISLAVAQLDRQDVVRGADCVDSPTLRRTTELLNERVGGAERGGGGLEG